MTINDFFSFDITPYTTPKQYFAGDTINQEGSDVQILLFIEEGTATCTDTEENGVENLIAYLQGPCFIGDLELVGARKSSSGVTAITDCTCTVIHLSRCRDLVLNDVKFLQYLCKNFAQKTVRNSRNMLMGKSYPLKNRLATFLLDMQNKGLYTIPHTEASSYLGVSYRHFLFVMKEFQEDGWIEKTRSGYRISNQRALEELYIHQIQ